MKKVIFLFSILLIISTTLTLGFYFLKTSKTKNVRTHSLTQDMEADKVEKTVLPSLGGEIKILLVGDMMFDRWIRQVAEKKGQEFIFQGVKDLLQNANLVVGNLEGPITDKPSVSLDSKIGSKENYVFTFLPEIAKNLFSENIRLVNIGNNHILNFGEDGLADTKKYLVVAGVNFFGNTGKSDGRFFIKDVGGIKIAFVNYNQFVNNGKNDALYDLQAVKELKPDFIVVYTHWGTEFMDKPSERNKELAHEFIDKGADLIIGSHPHVVQTKEKYRSKMVYYSLGNFIFDQYFNPNTQEGLVVEVVIDSINKNITTQEYFVKLKNNGQTLLRVD